ncbi:MAG: hypothetical protein JNM34_07790 [Chthonomonadaceae bacterium]|nr:hypothetical protein [Chthonomonadaceae bacterium]
MQSFLDAVADVWEPHPGQREFLLQPAKIKVLACGRRWGKTEVCAAQIVQALTRPFPTKHLVLAPTVDQAHILYQKVLSFIDKIFERQDGKGSKKLFTERPKVKKTPFPSLTLGRHTVVARSGHVPRSLRGNEATHIVVDEAAYLPEALVSEVAMPMLATTDGYLTLISTPHGKNHFWRFFMMGQNGENGVWSQSAPSSESPFVSPTYLSLQRDLVSERAFAVEYGAQFHESSNQVFKSDCVQACLVAAMPTLTGPFVIGVDWARYSDYTAVAVLSGDRDQASLAQLDRFHGLTWSETVRRVASIVERFPGATVLCDSTGIGDAMLEQLQLALPTRLVEGLTFTLESKGRLIDNLAWLIERAALRFEPDPQLLRELEHFEAKVSGNGTHRLAATGGYHDDLVIALALAANQLHKVYRPTISMGPRRQF